MQELAGHTSLAMTQRYIEGDTEAKRKSSSRSCKPVAAWRAVWRRAPGPRPLPHTSRLALGRQRVMAARDGGIGTSPESLAGALLGHAAGTMRNILAFVSLGFPWALLARLQVSL